MIRIVKMVFRPDKAEEFLRHFEEAKQKIRNFPGCAHLELWRDKNNPSVFFTYSHWGGVEDLEAYRKSELFKATWAKVKPLFAEKAEAWTVENLIS